MKNTFKELQTVILNRDIDDFHLKNGDVGTIVHVYENGKAYEVEFFSSTGKTVGVLSLNPKDISPIVVNEKPSFYGDLGNFEFSLHGAPFSLHTSTQSEQQLFKIVSKGNKSQVSSFCYPFL